MTNMLIQWEVFRSGSNIERIEPKDVPFFLFGAVEPANNLTNSKYRLWLPFSASTAFKARVGMPENFDDHLYDTPEEAMAQYEYIIYEQIRRIGSLLEQVNKGCMPRSAQELKPLLEKSSA